MHLIFDGWDRAAAADVAHLVLEPDAATFLVLGPVCVFEGFAPVDGEGRGCRPSCVRTRLPSSRCRSTRPT